MRKIIAVVSLIMIMGAIGSPACGESPKPTPAHGPDDWQFPATVYLWAVGLDGDMTVKGNDVSVSESFSDILEDLDIALEGHFELWKGRWGLMFDATYVKLDADGGTGNVGADITQKITLIDFGALYRAGNWPMGSTGRNRLMLDLMVGGRYTDLDVDIEPDRLPSFGGDEGWTDLIAGVRLITDLGEKWSLILRGDLGGFGISGSSDFSANGVFLVDWQFYPRWSVLGGYRALYQDYEKGSGPDKFKYDITTHGPVLGLTYRF